MKQSARIKNMDQTLKNTLGICALLAFCFGAAIASGYHLEYEYGYRYSAVGALASVVFLLLLARGFPRVSSVVLLIYVGTTALYLPVGWLYGAPSYQIVGSILESNPAEAREFVGNLPGSLYFVQALFFIFGLTVWKYCVSVGVFADVKNYKRRSKIWLTILLTLILSCAVMEKIAGDKDWREPDAGLLLNIFDLYYDLASAPAQYAAKRAHILEAAKKASTWHIRHVAPKYKNYVVVIGESARSDYYECLRFPIARYAFFESDQRAVDKRLPIDRPRDESFAAADFGAAGRAEQ